MSRSPQDVTEAELAVLRLLWERSGASIREMADELYSGGGQAQYATVQKLLERLENKGHVQRLRDTSPQRFAAAVGRDQLIGRRLRDLAEKLCGGSLTPLLTHLASSETFTPDELQTLRRLVDELGRKPRRPKR